MASIILTPKGIFEQEFKASMRGYDRKEVDEFLDDVIKDYETYITLVKELREENESLKKKLQQMPAQQPMPSRASTMSDPIRPTVAASATNYDILKRISRLEKEVFGKQIVE